MAETRVAVTGGVGSKGIATAVIIADGLGTRARSMTGDRIPGGLAAVDGIPLAVRQMQTLAREGVRTLHILADHPGARLLPALAPEAERLGLDLHVVAEERPLGTGGCLTALGAVEEDMLIVYGDLLFEIDLGRVGAHVATHPACLTMIAHPGDHPRTSDIVVVRDGCLERILPRRQPRDADWRNLVPAGLYVASPAFFAALRAGETADMVHDVIPSLLERKIRVGVYATPEYIRDIGSPERQAAAEADLRAGRPAAMHLSRRRPAVFFDCDGVLNQEPGSPGVTSPDQLRLIPGAAEAVRLVREHGFFAIAATNRSQVAKGLITEDELGHILGRLEAELAAGKGVLDRIYYCPHHPEGGSAGEVAALKIRCECRKPGNLLLRRAAEDLPIEMDRSAIIGDTLRDIGAGRRSGIWSYGVRTGHGCRDGDVYPRDGGGLPTPDLMFDDVLDAARFQCGYRTLARRALPGGLPARGGDGGPVVIALCGRSRAGKSVLAHAIERSATEDGRNPLRVELDRWIVPTDQRAGMSPEERLRVSLYRDLIATLRGGGEITAPACSALPGWVAQDTVYDASGRDLILLDGVLAGHRDAADEADIRIFVDGPEATLAARFAGYHAWKGLDRKAIDALWRECRDAEWPVVDAQRPTADIVFSMDNDQP